ncbi:hypothetical protein VTP01DRAFT_10107 [Rhizomucor pusillus]|uniref:uncharacterized protein n=1 Tax=Rhizomucor pusillus TaxID=4840 RepID=UPI0037443896
MAQSLSAHSWQYLKAKELLGSWKTVKETVVPGSSGASSGSSGTVKVSGSTVGAVITGGIVKMTMPAPTQQELVRRPRATNETEDSSNNTNSSYSSVDLESCRKKKEQSIRYNSF